LLAKIEVLQRQVDEFNRGADLDARLRERVGELEKTHSLEARFIKLANDVKRELEIPRSVLLSKIEHLQRQFDELKKVAAQPGPQGPPGKLPCVKEYVAECVHYEADVVTHYGALWQACVDTVHAPPHDDWICLARSGRDGLTPNVRGTYSAYDAYKKLDIVAMDGAAFIAKRDNPGICPSDGWQMISRQGRQGRKGETVIGPRGAKGDEGEPGTMLRSWQLDRERYRISPLMSDGTVGPMMELRPLFEWFLHETSGWRDEVGK
jgi:hypothetical protein